MTYGLNRCFLPHLVRWSAGLRLWVAEVVFAWARSTTQLQVEPGIQVGSGNAAVCSVGLCFQLTSPAGGGGLKLPQVL